MISLIAWTQWQRVGLGVVLGVVGVVLGALAVRAFMRGARAEGMRRRMAREAQDAQANAAAVEALRRSRARGQSRSEYEGRHPPVGGPTRAD